MVGQCFTFFPSLHPLKVWKRILCLYITNRQNTEWFQLHGIDPESLKADQSQIESNRDSLRPQEMFPGPDATAQLEGLYNVIFCTDPESYLTSNCVVSFALLALSTTPKHPFRQTTSPCSRAPAANERWIVWLGSSRVPWIPERTSSGSTSSWDDAFVELQCLPTTTIEHEAMDCDKSHRLRCTRGSRSHQSKAPVAQYYLDVMLAGDAGFHNLNYQVKKHENWHLWLLLSLICLNLAKSVASKMNKKSPKRHLWGDLRILMFLALLFAKFQRLSSYLNMMTS